MNSNEILTNWQQYKSELQEYPRLTDEQHWELTERARSGDAEAKHGMIQACLWYVSHIALKYKGALRHDDLLDLVQIGNTALVTKLEHSLTQPNPIAYLMATARLEITHYVSYRVSLISRWQAKHEVVWTESLDAPLYRHLDITLLDLLSEMQVPATEEVPVSQERRALYDLIMQAIEKLPARQKYIVLRHYGLDGEAPEELGDLSRRLSSNPSATLASSYLQAALKNLRKWLL